MDLAESWPEEKFGYDLQRGREAAPLLLEGRHGYARGKEMLKCRWVSAPLVLPSKCIQLFFPNATLLTNSTSRPTSDRDKRLLPWPRLWAAPLQQWDLSGSFSVLPASSDFSTQVSTSGGLVNDFSLTFQLSFLDSPSNLKDWPDLEGVLKDPWSVGPLKDP